jgi:hypothetical protein
MRKYANMPLKQLVALWEERRAEVARRAKAGESTYGLACELYDMRREIERRKGNGDNPTCDVDFCKNYLTD